MNKWTNFKVEKGNNNKTLTVPMQRAHRGCPKLEFSKPNKWGGGLKIAIRQVAKKLPEYHLPIQNQVLPMTVETQEGKKIEVNTLGKWAFGVPGYAGHLVFEGYNQREIAVYYPEGSPRELLEMLEKAVKLL